MTAEKTVLEKAKEIETGKKTFPLLAPTEENIDLFLALVRGEIQMIQAARALGTHTGTHTSYRLLLMLSAAVKIGRVDIIKRF